MRFRPEPGAEVPMMHQHSSAVWPWSGLIRRIPGLLAALLLVLPSLWLGGGALLGSDDSRLYTVYPEQWLFHVALPAFGNPSLSGFSTFGTDQYYTVFVAVFSAISKLLPYLNLQAMAYGIALASGFIGVYWTVTLVVAPDSSCIPCFAAIIAGLSYTLCPLVATFYWTSPLAWVIGIGGAPLLVSLAIVYIRSGQSWWIVAYSFGTAFFAIGLQAIPITLSYILACSFVFVVFLLRSTQRVALYFRRGLVVVIAGLASSAFWLVPLGISVTEPGAYGSSVLTAAESASEMVQSVARGQSILDTLLLLPPPAFMRIWNWPQLAIWNNWYRYLQIPSLVLIAVIGGGLLVSRKCRILPDAALLLLPVLVVLAYVQTVSVSPYGVDLFALFVSRVPGMFMFRDFFNKGTGAYVFCYAVILAVCLVSISKFVSFWYRLLICVAISLVVVAQSVPMVLGTPLLLPITGSSVSDIGHLSPSFLQAMQFLANAPGYGRVLELPLGTRLFGSVIPLAEPDSVYRGISPVDVISGRETMNSFDSFATGGALELDQRIAEAVRSGNVATFRDVLRLSGVKYILYSEGYPAEAWQWLQQPVFPRDSATMAEWARAMGAMEVAKFVSGDSVSTIFALPDSSTLPMVFVTDGVPARTRPVGAPNGGDGLGSLAVDTTTALHPDSAAIGTVRRLFRWRYEVEIQLTEPSTLVLLEPYVSGWTAIARPNGLSSNGRMLAKVDVNGFASGWLVPDAGRFTVDLIYEPQKLTWASLALSAGFMLLTIIWSTDQTIRRARRRTDLTAADGRLDWDVT